MSVPVPFGQYYPAHSPVHRLDARAKIGVTAAFTLVLFAVEGWGGMTLLALFAFASLVSSRVPVNAALRGLKAVAFLMVFTVLANALRWRPEDALFMLGPFGVDQSGLLRGLFFGARIMLLVLGTSLVTLTTSPVALTDALSSLMKPLKVVRFPVDDVAMMLSIALRFVPTTAEEAERIIVAQTARGARFDEGGPIRRARAWIPVLVPLFVRLFRRADDLAVAMETRCYTGSGRTRLRAPVMTRTDWLTLIIVVTLFVATAILY